VFNRIDLASIIPNPRLLVVEDDKDSAEQIISVLEPLGIDARHAADGQAGLQLTYDFGPDVILTDINMPRMRGDEMVIELCRLGFKKPIILMTGFNITPVAVLALRYRVFDILEKPIATERLGIAVFKAFEFEAHRQMQEERVTSAMNLLMNATPSQEAHQVMDMVERGARELYLQRRTKA